MTLFGNNLSNEGTNTNGIDLPENFFE